jgi:tetratricopeptide (TPR) repeat protein
MPTLNYLYRLPTLLLFLLILPQCADKSSSDYVKEGYQYIEQQEYQKAENAFLNAIEKDPGNADGFYGLGGIHNNNKKYDKAIEALKKVLTLDPTHYNAYYSLGYSHEQMGNKKEAEKNYQTFKRLKKKMEKILNEDPKKI